MKGRKVTILLAGLVIAIWGAVAYSFLQNAAPDDLEFAASEISKHNTQEISSRQSFDPISPDPFAMPRRLFTQGRTSIRKPLPPVPQVNNTATKPKTKAVPLPELVGVTGKLALFSDRDTTVSILQPGDSIAGYTVMQIAKEKVHLVSANSDTTLFVNQISLSLNP